MSSHVILKFFRMSIATGLTMATFAAVIPELIDCFITADTHLRQQSDQQFEQEQQAIVTQAIALAAAENYQACVIQAAKVSPEANVYREAQTYGRNCQNYLTIAQLERAKQRAEKGEFVQAIKDASQIVVGSPFYNEAQQLIRQWSERLLAVAESYYWQPLDQLDQALTIAGTIPPYSPIYAEVQTQMQQWQQLWANNFRCWIVAHQALDLGKFDEAMTQAQQIEDHPFWTPNRNSFNQMVQERRLQQQYKTVWETAEQFLVQGEPENAIATAVQLPNLYPWGERKQQLIDRAETKQRQVTLCQTLSLKLLGCH